MENVSLIEKEKYLNNFKWSSLRGYLNKDNIESFVDYRTILAEYGGDNQKGSLYLGKPYKVTFLQSWK